MGARARVIKTPAPTPPPPRRSAGRASVSRGPRAKALATTVYEGNGEATRTAPRVTGATGSCREAKEVHGGGLVIKGQDGRPTLGALSRVTRRLTASPASASRRRRFRGRAPKGARGRLGVIGARRRVVRGGRGGLGVASPKGAKGPSQRGAMTSPSASRGTVKGGRAAHRETPEARVKGLATAGAVIAVLIISARTPTHML